MGVSMTGLMSPLNGILNSMQQFNQAASDIARAPLAGSGGQDMVSLSTAAVAMIQSKNNFEANIKALKVEDEKNQTLLNVVG